MLLRHRAVVGLWTGSLSSCFPSSSSRSSVRTFSSTTFRLADEKDPQTAEGKTNDILSLITKLKQGDNPRGSGGRLTVDLKGSGDNDKQGQFQGRGRGRGQYQGRGQGQFRERNDNNNNNNGPSFNGNRRGNFAGARGGRGGGRGGYNGRNNNFNDDDDGGQRSNYFRRNKDADEVETMTEEDLEDQAEFDAFSQHENHVTLTEDKEKIVIEIGSNVEYDVNKLRDSLKKVEALGNEVIMTTQEPETFLSPLIVDCTAQLISKAEGMSKNFQGITPAPEEVKDFATRLDNFVSKPHDTNKTRVIEHFGIRDPLLETSTAAFFSALDPATNQVEGESLSDLLPKEVEDSLITEERRLQNQKEDAECVKILNFMVKELSRAYNPFTIGYDDRINGLELIEELSLVLDQRLRRRKKHEILRQRSRQKKAEKRLAAGLPAVMQKPPPVSFPRCDKTVLRNGFFTIQDLFADAWDYFCANSSYKKYEYCITEHDREHFRAVLKLHCSGLYHNATIPYASKRKWLKTLTKFYVRATVFNNFFTVESKRVRVATEDEGDTSEYHSEDWYEDEEDDTAELGDDGRQSL